MGSTKKQSVKVTTESIQKKLRIELRLIYDI